LTDNNFDELRQYRLAYFDECEIKTIDAETLVNTPLEATPFVVSELIPQGLHILGGAAKIGKSWLMLWLGLQIAKGQPIWNYESRQ
jgi:RecA-family ATPase